MRAILDFDGAREKVHDVLASLLSGSVLSRRANADLLEVRVEVERRDRDLALLVENFVMPLIVLLTWHALRDSSRSETANSVPLVAWLQGVH